MTRYSVVRRTEPRGEGSLAKLMGLCIGLFLTATRPPWARESAWGLVLSVLVFGGYRASMALMRMRESKRGGASRLESPTVPPRRRC